MLTFSVTPGKTFEAGEKCTNDKLNLLGQPAIAVDGGLENAQLRGDAWFAANNNGSVVNAYVGEFGATEQDPSTLVDGLVVAFKIPVANTGSSTFQLKKSDGTSLGTAAIKKRGRDVISGDLALNRWVELRYESGSGTWQLTDTALVEGADVVPGAVWWGTNNASTATAYVMKFTPAPAALVTGMRVAFAAPVTSGANPSLQLQDGAGANIGPTNVVKRAVSGLVVSAGEVPAGTVIEVIYDGTAWIVQTPLTVAAASALSNGLVIANNAVTPLTKIDVAADELMVSCVPGHGGRLLTAVVFTLDTGLGTAPNGLDAALSGTACWYYIWVLFNPTSGTVAGVLSQSRTGPDLSAAALSGFTHRALVGAARWTGALFQSFFQTGRQVFIQSVRPFTGKQATSADTWQALSAGELTIFQGAVPPNARMVLGFAGASTNGSDGSNALAVALAADANGLGEQRVMGAILAGAFPWAIGGVNTYGAGNFRLPMIPATYGLYWKSYSNSANQLNFLAVTGFEL